MNWGIWPCIDMQARRPERNHHERQNGKQTNSLLRF